MNVKTIRLAAGVTQSEFATKYHIPLQTLKQWESTPGSASYRKPPEYILHMLRRLAMQDYGIQLPETTPDLDPKAAFLIDAAQKSRFNAKHWLRYLRKLIKDETGEAIPINSAQIQALRNNKSLTMFQKISLQRALCPGTPTNDYVRGLGRRTQTPMIHELMRRHSHAGS